MAKKDELIAKAVELDLGTEEDLKGLTIADLEELLEDDPKAKVLEQRKKDEGKPVKPFHEGMTTVEDLIANGSIAVADGKAAT